MNLLFSALALLAIATSADAAITLGDVNTGVTDFHMDNTDVSTIEIGYTESTVAVTPANSEGTAVGDMYFRWETRSVTDCSTAMDYAPWVASGNQHGTASGGNKWTLTIQNNADWDTNAASTHGVRTTAEQYQFCLVLKLYYNNGGDDNTNPIMDSKTYKFTLDGYGAGSFTVDATGRDVAANAADLATIDTETLDFGTRKDSYLQTNMVWSAPVINAFGDPLVLDLGAPSGEDALWTISNPTNIKAKYGPTAGTNDQTFTFPAGMVTIADVALPYEKQLTLLLPELLYTDPDGEIDIEMTITYSYVSVARNRGLRALAAGEEEEEETEIHDREVTITRSTQLEPLHLKESSACDSMAVSSMLAVGGMALVALV